MESLFLKIRPVTLLLLGIPVIVSSVMNPGDAVTGLSEIMGGLYRSGSSLLSFHAGSGAKSTSSS